jgi:hypothetical protein
MRSIRPAGRSRTIGSAPSEGPQAVDPGREYVDGVQARKPITEGQRQAVLRLNRAERDLGADGSALVHDVLVRGMTMEQIGQQRCLPSQRWKGYFSRRSQECLDRLALLYGCDRESAAENATAIPSRPGVTGRAPAGSPETVVSLRSRQNPPALKRSGCTTS